MASDFDAGDRELSSIALRPGKSARNRGPNAAPGKRQKRNYLLKPEYRKVSLDTINEMTESELAAYLEKTRWGHYGANVQACPKCGAIDSHYRCRSINGWKCRGCAKQFTVLSGTRVHGMKMDLKKFMSIALHFIEAKDSMSARELSGLHDLNHQTAHVLTLKIREAIRETMSAEPLLEGYVQADAAYFMKYVRPGNVGTGASLAAKEDRKNAGLSESNKIPATVSENMHALVVFVQAGQQGKRRYRMAMVKTENKVDMLTLGQQFCDKKSVLVTDQHQAYSYFSGEFVAHHQVNHNREFMTKEGFNTNLAEGIFSRIRAAVHGAWHRMSLQNLVEYGWELAWRQQMVGSNNEFQLTDLMQRILTSGRANRFVDYWQKRPEDKRPPREEVGMLREVSKDDVLAKRGRPSKDSVRPKPAQSSGDPFSFLDGTSSGTA